MNEEHPTPEQPAEAAPEEARQDDAQSREAQPREAQPPDPRRRLRDLLAIPERDRTDPIWDEIVVLEIQLAPGNRASAPQNDPGRRPDASRRQDQGRRQEQGRRPDQVRRQEPGGGAKPAKRSFHKSRRGPGASNKG